MSQFDPPDLSRIPREEWYAALARVTHFARCSAANRLSDPAERDAAYDVALELFLEHGDGPQRPEVRRATPRLPTPEPPAGRPDRRGVQVNVRLRRSDHALLGEAAELVGLTPTELARAFMVDGTRRLLAQRDRDPDDGLPVMPRVAD